MRRVLLVAALVAAGVAWSAGPVSAQAHHQHRPYTTSVTWPSANPPGWYTNTYMHKWYFPWYAYYDFSYGPYANWASSGAYATYTYHGPAGYYNYPLQEHTSNGKSQAAPQASESTESGSSTAPATPATPATPGQVSVTLPSDAKLLFNGAAATGTGAVRTFRTPALQPGTNYRYELTAEVTRDGRTERVTETVVVRAGETAKVTLTPTNIATAGAK